MFHVEQLLKLKRTLNIPVEIKSNKSNKQYVSHSEVGMQNESFSRTSL